MRTVERLQKIKALDRYIDSQTEQIKRLESQALKVTAGAMEKKLHLYGFFRIHKSYLVNLECITEIFPWTRNGLALKLKGYENTVLPVGREKLKMTCTPN